MLFEWCIFLTSWLWCNPPVSLSVREDLMAPPLGILTHYVWVQCIMDRADTVKENIICRPKEHKGLDMECDTHWGTNKMLNILRQLKERRGSQTHFCVCDRRQTEIKNKSSVLHPQSLCWSKVTLLFFLCISIQTDLPDCCSSGGSAFWLVLIQTKSQLGHTHGNNQTCSGRNI